MKTALTHDIDYIRAQIAGIFASKGAQIQFGGRCADSVALELNAMLDFDVTHYVSDVRWDSENDRFVVLVSGSADDIEEYCAALSDYFPEFISVEPEPWLTMTAHEAGALTPLGMALAVKRGAEARW